MDYRKDIYRKNLITYVPSWFEFYEGTDTPYLGKEREHQILCFQLQKLAADIVSHRYEKPFFAYRKRKQLCAGSSQLGSDLLVVMQAIQLNELPSTWLNESRIIFSPDVSTTIKILRTALTQGEFVPEGGEIAPLQTDPEYYWMAMPEDVPKSVDEMNKLAATLRKALCTPAMRSQVKSFRRNATKRYNAAMVVAHQAWEKNRKNLLIRIDWSFRKKHPAVSIGEMTQEEFEQHIKEVEDYRDLMLKLLRLQFGDDLTFFLWKIECGEFKGLHIHWLIAVNASYYQDRVNVPRMITETWDRAIGRDDAYSFNVNGKFTGQSSGLRVIQYNDPELGEILGRYCDYLTKVDYIMKLRLPKGTHSIGRTKLKENLLKKGPRRKYSMAKIDFKAVRGAQGSSQKRPSFGRYSRG